MENKKKIFNQFSKGFISSLDVDTLKVPSDALSDCINVEINNPALMIARSLGYAQELALPTYSGIPVSFRKWSVDEPSAMDITTLIMKSNNLLKYSEFFDITSAWTFTAAGATLTTNYAAAPKRKSTRITNADLTTELLQSVAGLNTASTYTFSIYVKNASHTQFILFIDGVASAPKLTTGSGFERFTFSNTPPLSGATIEVKIRFTGAVGTDEFEVWGAQFEESATATVYGYTTNIKRPYYIFINPYYIDGTWTVDWLELTEMNAGNVSTSDSTSFTIPNIGNAGIDFTHFIYHNEVSPGYGGYVMDITGDAIEAEGVVSSVISAGNNVILNRFAPLSSAGDSANLRINQDNIDESKISYSEYNGKQFICLGYNCSPLIISYIKKTVGEFGRTLTMDRFFLDTEVKYKVNNQYSDGLFVVVAPLTSAAGAGSTRTFFVVAIYDGQRYSIYKNTITVASPFDYTQYRITIDLFLYINFTHRLEKLEVYMADNSVDEQDALLIDSIDIATLWTLNESPGANSYRKEVTYTISSLIFGASLVQNIQRAFDSTSVTFYDGSIYIRGRRYVYGVNTSFDIASHAVINDLTPSNKSNDIVRFSTIANLNQEVNNFSFVYSAGYGYIIVEQGSTDNIVGLAKTPQSDLLILKNRSTYLYEIASQSSQLGRRLIQAFQGIGCSNSRSIIQSSDYGNFWWDENGVYNYFGGVNPPVDISLGKIKKFWKALRDSGGVHIGSYASSFGYLNRSINEYWMFLKIGSGATAASYKILRYSLEYKNFNWLQFDKIPVCISEKQNGEIEILFSDDSAYIYKYGYTTNQLQTSNLTTHLVNLDDDSEYKQLLKIFAEYSSTSNLEFTLSLNDEGASTRDGNTTITFLSSLKNDQRFLRNGSIANKFYIKLVQSTGTLTTFNISSFGVSCMHRDRKLGG